MDAYELGRTTEKILDNPYWKSYPKPSTPEDETAARRFVDGWVDAKNEALSAN